MNDKTQVWSQRMNDAIESSSEECNIQSDEMPAFRLGFALGARFGVILSEREILEKDEVTPAPFVFTTRAPIKA